MVRRFRVPCAAALIAACAVTARPDIVSHGAQIQVRPPDTSPSLARDTGRDTQLDRNEYESDNLIRVWLERSVRLNAGMLLDHVTFTSPVQFPSNGNAALTPGTIPILTRLDSYYLLFDPATRRTRLSDSSGSLSITFDTEILGFALDNAGITKNAVGLRESDDASGDAKNTNQAFEGPSPLTYNNFAARGFELGTGTNQDRFVVSSDRRTLTILNVFADTDYDALRIFVAGVPEPATLSLFCAGAVGMFWLLRTRRCGAAVRRSLARRATGAH